MAWQIPAAMIAASVIPSLLNKNKKTEQVPLETPEQRAARTQLMGFAETGKYGDFTAGEQLPLGYGDYGMTGLEQQGQSTLQQLLGGGIPEMFKVGDTALMDFLKTDPADVSAQFDPFRAQVQRQVGESERGLKRGAGALGSLYGTDTVRQLGDIQARGNETLTAELARLTDSALNRRLSAIPLAYQSAEAQQQAGLQQVAASQQYGGLARQLNDASIKARDAELLRRRSELGLPLEALKAVAGQGANFGIPSIETSPYQDLLGMVGQVGGRLAGDAASMAMYKKYFPGQTPTPPQPADYGNYTPRPAYPGMGPR